MTFQPAFASPAQGLRTWSRPDGSLPNGPEIPAGLELELVERLGDWADVRCSNGWSAWVDARALVALAAPPPPLAPAVAAPPPPRAPAPAPTTAPEPVVAAFVAPVAGTSVLSVPSTLAGRIVFAAGVALGALTFLPWISAGTFSATSWKVPAAFLVDTTSDGAPWLAWLLLALGAATVLLAMSGRGAAWARVIGAVIAAVGVLFVVQIERSPGGSFDNIAAGPWLTILAGLTCAAAPSLAARTATAGVPTSAAATAAPASVSVPAPVTAPTPAPAAGVWQPTHRVPGVQLACYAEPEPASVLAAHLDPGLDLRVDEWRGAWAHVTCSNGWTTWVDGRQLLTVN